MSTPIGNTITRGAANAASAATAASNSQRSEASASIFASLLKAEQASPQPAASATTADAAATPDTLAVRFEDRIFQMQGKVIDMSTVQATPLAELPQDRYDDALATMERTRDTLSLAVENQAANQPGSASAAGDGRPAVNLAALQADPAYSGIVSQIDALKAARTVYLQQLAGAPAAVSPA